MWHWQWEVVTVEGGADIHFFSFFFKRSTSLDLFPIFVFVLEGWRMLAHYVMISEFKQIMCMNLWWSFRVQWCLKYYLHEIWAPAMHRYDDFWLGLQKTLGALCFDCSNTSFFLNLILLCHYYNARYSFGVHDHVQTGTFKDTGVWPLWVWPLPSLNHGLWSLECKTITEETTQFQAFVLRQ